jgi:CRISPR/Cas system-associated exonuclease Cas4 (RecB family)
VSEDRNFETRLGTKGVWPDAPSYWSHSSLSEASACPRRYALRRSRFEGIWDRSGYPGLASESAIAGSTVHRGVEVIVRALRDRGCGSVRDADAVAVLRDLGGFTEIVSTALDDELAKHEDNPRMARRLPLMRSRLQQQVPAMREALQVLTSRITVVSAPSRASHRGASGVGEGGARALIEGTFSEVELASAELRYRGWADLLTVDSEAAEIVDIKTGEPREHHADQVVRYGLLWTLDRATNPDRLPVRKLQLSYPAGDESVPVPPDWEAVEADLEAEILEADREIAASPPAARPSEACTYCTVRHMCEEYWSSTQSAISSASSFGDADLTLVSRNGPTSWLSKWSTRMTEAGDVLLRTKEGDEGLLPGRRVRLLGVAVRHDPDLELLVVSTTVSSEIYVLADEAIEGD